MKDIGPKASVIEFLNVSKSYVTANRPLSNLWHALKGRGGVLAGAPSYTALHSLSLTINAGEVVGLVGLNGAGKSTLLHLVAKTISPTQGKIDVNGSVGAILELGAGFNPEFTGRENAELALMIANTPATDKVQIIDEVIAFADIGAFIDQPIKTYSSGMLMRLAFAVATCQTPKILIVDEALSVGDGAFARKSFDRIMRLREDQTTILFCSHSLFQVEALCSRVLWLHQGRQMAWGPTKEVLAQYDAFLLSGGVAKSAKPTGERELAVSGADLPPLEGTARFTNIQYSNERGDCTSPLSLKSELSTLQIRLTFASDPALPAPSVGLTIKSSDGNILTSTATFMDRVIITRDTKGFAQVELTLPAIPLLKGAYGVDVYLMCEKGIFIYDSASQVLELSVEQDSLVQGKFAIPHTWTPLEGGVNVNTC